MTTGRPVGTAGDLKVLFSHDIFLAQAHGGASRLFAGLHRALLAGGVQSRVSAGLHSNTYLTGQRSVLGVRLPGAASSIALRRAARLCDVAFERAVLRLWNPSVYHLTYFPRRTGPVPVPVVLTVLDMIHELYPEQFPGADPTSERKRHWTKAADLVVAISDQTKKDLMARFDVPQEKVVVVHPGVDRMVPDPAFDVRPYGDYLLYVGERAIPYKNFAGLAVAMTRAESAGNLALVCFGTPMTAQERQLLESLGLLSRVHVVSGSDGHLAALYAGARALVYPSRYEGFGLPPVEAMALGCPVACSRGGALPEVVGDAALAFDADDVDEMATAIDRIVADESLRQDLVTAGSARAQELSWDRSAAAMVDAYRRLVGTAVEGPVA